MHKSMLFLFFVLILAVNGACHRPEKAPEEAKKPLLEVEGKFLYEEDIQKIIPPNVNDSDSIDIAHGFIRKWVTDVLLYENAKRNISNQKEIDDLVEAYRKSLIINQYQQRLIEQRLPGEPTDEDLQAFYSEYSKELLLKESIIKGLLLVVPSRAPQLANVRTWVQSGNTASLEKIEKYSIQNAVSYDYFGDKWISFSEVLKKIPLQVTDASAFVASHRFVEVSDSVQHYFLRIESYRNPGQTEPFEWAKNRISIILMNKKKADFISKFDEELYNDAVKNETVNFLKNK